MMIRRTVAAAKNMIRRVLRVCCNSIFGLCMCILFLGIFVAGWYCTYYKGFRLDQNAVTIFSTTAGIIGTMFGLTAASYAFIWGDVRSDSQENCHLIKVLERYRTKLWRLFVLSLALTAAVIFTSLIGLTLAQFITNLSLFWPAFEEGRLIFEYHNAKNKEITILAVFNLVLSAVALTEMVRMNWSIFYRNKQYANMAGSILHELDKKYDTILEQSAEKERHTDSIEYEKIHNIEMLVERILKNHESIGDAFAEAQRREKLLSAVMTNRLNAICKTDQKKEGDVERAERIFEWEYLEEKKRISRMEQCAKKADWEYKQLTQKNMGNWRQGRTFRSQVRMKTHGNMSKNRRYSRWLGRILIMPKCFFPISNTLISQMRAWKRHKCITRRLYIQRQIPQIFRRQQ